MIPKVIYYVWFGPKPLSRKAKDNIRTWKELNPDFKIIQIDESNFDITKYKFAYDAYNQKDWAFVSDVARLDCIYNNGGFYFDTDVALRKSLKSLLSYKSVWALENSNAINPGLVLAAEKGDFNLEQLLNIYKNKKYNSKSYDKVIVPIVTKYFLDQGFKIKNKKQILPNQTLILPTEYFAPFHLWGGGHITKNTIGIHQYAASWVTPHKLSSFFKIKQQLICDFPTLYFSVRKLRDRLSKKE